VRCRGNAQVSITLGKTHGSTDGEQVRFVPRQNS
jgi:hypothetical protein